MQSVLDKKNSDYNLLKNDYDSKILLIKNKNEEIEELNKKNLSNTKIINDLTSSIGSLKDSISKYQKTIDDQEIEINELEKKLLLKNKTKIEKQEYKQELFIK